MRSTLLQNIGYGTCVALLSVCLAGCMTKTTTTKVDDKCTDDCCKDDGKAVVVNKGKDTTAHPSTQPAAVPATQPAN